MVEDRNRQQLFNKYENHYYIRIYAMAYQGFGTIMFNIYNKSSTFAAYGQFYKINDC